MKRQTGAAPALTPSRRGTALHTLSAWRNAAPLSLAFSLRCSWGLCGRSAMHTKEAKPMHAHAPHYYITTDAYSPRKETHRNRISLLLSGKLLALFQDEGGWLGELLHSMGRAKGALAGLGGAGQITLTLMADLLR